MGRFFIRPSLTRTAIVRRGVLVLLCALIGTTLAPHSRAADGPVIRTWTSADGKFSTRGELLSRDAKSVTLRNDSGREVTVPLSRLCKEDLAYLKSLTKADARKNSDPKKKLSTKSVGKKVSTSDAKKLAAESKADKAKPKKPAAPPTEISQIKDYDEFKTQLAKAFGAKQYDLLEATKNALLTDDETFPQISARPKLELFYVALARRPLGPLGLELPFDEAINDWVKTNPKSKTALLVAGQFEIVAAWQARGSGVSSTVTEQGAKIFAERIDRARIILARVSDLEGEDPDFYRQLFIVARAQSWDWKSATRFYTELMEKAPDYYPAHAQVAMMLMPRWGGEPDQMEQQTAASADKIGGTRGDEIYAQVVGEMLIFHRKQFFQETKFDYERAIRGFDSILSRIPDSSISLQEAGYIAALKNDVPRAGKYFTALSKVKSAGPAKIWTNQTEFAETSKRSIEALEKKPAGPLFAAVVPRVEMILPPGEFRMVPPEAAGSNAKPLPPPVAPLPEEAPWSPSTTPITVHKDGVYAIGFLPNSKFAVVAGASVDGKPLIGIWDVSSGANKLLERNTRPPNDDIAKTLSVSVHPAGGLVHIVGINQTHGRGWTYNVIRDPGAPNEIPSLKQFGSWYSEDSTPFSRFTSNGLLQLNSYARGMAAVDVLERGDGHRLFQRFEIKGSRVTAGAFSPDSHVLTCAFDNGQILFSVAPSAHATATSNPKPILISNKPIKQICFAADSKLVCCVEEEGTIHLYDIASQAVIGKLQAPGDLRQIDIHPDGRLLATAHGESDCVCLWDVVARKEVKRFTGHTGDVNTVSFASNGKVLASGSQDGTIRLWEVPTTK